MRELYLKESQDGRRKIMTGRMEAAAGSLFSRHHLLSIFLRLENIIFLCYSLPIRVSSISSLFIHSFRVSSYRIGSSSLCVSNLSVSVRHRLLSSLFTWGQVDTELWRHIIIPSPLIIIKFMSEVFLFFRLSWVSHSLVHPKRISCFRGEQKEREKGEAEKRCKTTKCKEHFLPATRNVARERVGSRCFFDFWFGQQSGARVHHNEVYHPPISFFIQSSPRRWFFHLDPPGPIVITCSLTYS